jgi:hypothetical protein
MIIKQQLVRAVLVMGATIFCLSSFADNNAGGDEFRATAATYAGKAHVASTQGQDAIAALYLQQAAIKTNAAALADMGQWSEIEWTQYHVNEGLIGEMLGAVAGNNELTKNRTVKNKTMKNQ